MASNIDWSKASAASIHGLIGDALSELGGPIGLSEFAKEYLQTPWSESLDPSPKKSIGKSSSTSFGQVKNTTAQSLAMRQVEQDRLKAAERARELFQRELRGVLCNENEASVITRFLESRPTAPNLANLILHVHFRRDFDAHHLHNVNAAELLAKHWTSDHTESFIKYLVADPAERQQMNAIYLKGGGNKTSTWQEDEAKLKDEEQRERLIELTRIDDVRRQAEKAKIEAHLRELAVKEAAELEEIVIAHERDNLGAGGW